MITIMTIIYIYIYIHVCRHRSMYINVYIYIYIYTCVCVYTYICIYIYIYIHIIECYVILLPLNMFRSMNTLMIALSYHNIMLTSSGNRMSKSPPPALITASTIHTADSTSCAGSI